MLVYSVRYKNTINNSPFHSIRAKHRDFMDLIKLFIISISTLFHSSWRNLFNSLRFDALRFSRRRLITEHRFSIELASGLFDGQSITSATSSSKNFLTIRLLCFGSLSCNNRQRRPNCFLALRIR